MEKKLWVFVVLLLVSVMEEELLLGLVMLIAPVKVQVMRGFTNGIMLVNGGIRWVLKFWVEVIRWVM